MYLYIQKGVFLSSKGAFPKVCKGLSLSLPPPPPTSRWKFSSVFHNFLLQNWWKKARGGGTLVLFVVRGRAIFGGTFFKPLRNYGCPFQGIFHNFRNYGPDIYSICGIMALKIHQNLRNYGYQFFGQNGTSPSHNRLSYPPPPEEQSTIENMSGLYCCCAGASRLLAAMTKPNQLENFCESGVGVTSHPPSRTFSETEEYFWRPPLRKRKSRREAK